MSLVSELKNRKIKPKKRLGQNFLISKNIAGRICQIGGVKKGDFIIEIGPGTGALTEKIIEKGANVAAIEKDVNLVSLLAEKFKGEGKLKIVNGDFLDIDMEKIVGNKKYKIIANLPYYISLPAIRKIFSLKNKPAISVLMLQKEVGERICSKPPKMSKLAVFCQLHSLPKIEMMVSRNNFFPKPKVDSVIIKLETKQSANEPKNFSRIISAAFSKPRKQLAGNLSKSFSLPKEAVENWLSSAGIKPKDRPQDIYLEQWIKLAKKFPLQDN